MELHFLLFEDEMAESGRQKTKENIIPLGKFRLVENGPNVGMKLSLIKLYRVSRKKFSTFKLK